MTRQPIAPGIRIFLLVWLGQLISLIGSGLTSFALGVWVYQKTGSVTQFALISFFTLLPTIFMLPVAGTLVDRWNRRWVMILSDSGSALTTLGIATILFLGHLEVGFIYLANAFSSLFSAFQWPAYTAATTLLIPKRHLGRANGLVQLGEAIAQLLSPMLAGFLLEIIQLQGIIFLDFSTFLFSSVILLCLRFPDLPTQSNKLEKKPRFWKEVISGWSYIIAHPGILSLLCMFALDNFLIGMIQVLFTPLVLSFSSAAVLGIILSTGGVGMLTGSLVMSAWGGPTKLINGVLFFQFVTGTTIFAAGWDVSVSLFMICAFLFFFCYPIILGCSQAILQKKVPLQIQGRVLSTRRMISLFSTPCAYLTAGLLADQVFQPLMVENGFLANSIGKLIGVGESRGIGLMFLISGTLLMVVSLFAYQYKPLRFIEKDEQD